MQRTFKDYFLISLKGIAMGAADAVPGVSGGTIALISGIYEELISTIAGVNFSLITTLRKEGFKAFWAKLNGNFLLALLTGIAVSFVVFMRIAKYLLEQHPILIWSFFFGLIIASIWFVGKQINKWTVPIVLSLIIGAIAAYYISTLPSLGANNSPYFLFLAGSIAICAMILPGISGSFILVILGAYKTLSDALHDFDIKKIAIFMAGAVIGLLTFSRVLKWLFKRHYNLTMALLTGFIIGSLNKVWPWKKTISVLDDQTGNVEDFINISDVGTLSIYQQQTNDFETYKTVLEESILPNTYLGDAQVWQAIALMIFGFLTIFILEKVGSKK
ncbi:DUF368 domain-containing protein [Psychroserpens sp. Hel_I_66]|uniref:DUF368 domain-containing protein n=1 Tax=Psychroserpens sp. Hel_I_66 TaxID=1250004 RepID=UPI0006475B87|nr:DUF368 domain-containing protein [Psychroserpens sp. Hel_I_66]